MYFVPFLSRFFHPISRSLFDSQQRYPTEQHHQMLVLNALPFSFTDPGDMLKTPPFQTLAIDHIAIMIPY